MNKIRNKNVGKGLVEMIRLEHINKNYKKKQVVFDFSMNIETQEQRIFGLLGPNGAGKTTIIKIMTGLLDFTDGKIFIDDSEKYMDWCKNNVVLIPAGERGVRYKNTVYDNVMCFAAMKGVTEKRVQTLIYEYAKVLNYTDFLKRRIETLSMGEKKKAMLLCGLCTDMKVIIMDEPSNGLDIDAQLEMKSLIKMLSTKLNKTFVISSHDMDFLSGMADRYIFMFQGRNACEVDGVMDIKQTREKYIKVKENFGGHNERVL